MGKEMAAAYYDASAATHPIGRVGCPDDIAEMALFLADPSKSGEWTAGASDCAARTCSSSARDTPAALCPCGVAQASSLARLW